MSEIHFKPKPLYSLVCDRDVFRVQVYERKIDEAIRSGHYTDTSDYNAKFLKSLNQTTKQAVSECLFHEKLGWSDQKTNYTVYLIQLAFLPLYYPDAKEVLTWSTAITFILNPVFNFFQTRHYERIQGINQSFQRLISQVDPEGSNRYFGHIPPFLTKRSWREAIFPIVPVDKWIKGRVFLARHGSKLVVDK